MQDDKDDLTGMMEKQQQDTQVLSKKGIRLR